ncbi:5-oxoprolinase subunit PxpB [Algoriphagus sp. AK58]|uniref:5-oxoprolinase subunit PxpB n=1 Tax=Algoriphagus sp. AK58 TaxID=1406877 RepID=UPI00164F07F8|nr:5-oxoprolinase subunit PxpB [Algoriphagus sp. AK58]
MRPHYMEITPLMGELVWNEAPNDELLSWQIGYMDFLKKNWSEKIKEFRQGFTRISVVWKKELFQIEFKNSLSETQLKPLPLPEDVWEIPVCYHEEFAPDLILLAEQKKLTPSQFIELHSCVLYRIHFFGFLPGFFYLNGLPEILHTPRKSVPILSVPRGSVAIGGGQTGIYPGESPGGWHIIGRTPISLFDPVTDPPVWAQPGDRIKFRAIRLEEFKNWPDIKPISSRK